MTSLWLSLQVSSAGFDFGFVAEANINLGENSDINNIQKYIGD